MTAQQIATILPYVLVSMFLLAIMLFILALQQLRRGRKGAYWRLRRQAGQRGGRLLLAAVGLLILTLGLAFYSGLAAIAFRGIDSVFGRNDSSYAGVFVPTLTPTRDETPTPSATPTLTLTATQVSTVTIRPTTQIPETATLTASPTETSTVTLTPTLTQTPSITPPPSATFAVMLRLTPPSSARPAAENARINLIAADDEVTRNATPLEPQSVFAAGIKRIYLFMNFQDMENGAAWTRILFRDDVPIQGQAYLWSMGREGSGYFFFGNDAGYEAGQYEVRIYLRDEVVSQFPFTISE